MDRYKIDQALERKVEKIDRDIESQVEREPIEEYNRMFFKAEIPYEDCLLDAKVIICKEKLKSLVRGISLEAFGPWVLFKIEDVLEGDPEGLIDMGAAVLARWDKTRKVYRKYIYKPDPTENDKEVALMASLTNMSESEIVRGSVR